MHDPARLEAALAPLVGRPLWASHRAVDVQVFQFGDKRTVTSNFGPRKGQQREVGAYALHVQCAWRIHGPEGIVVGSRDRYVRPDSGRDPENDDDWDWSAPGANRCDERLGAWLQARAHDVERVRADATGGLVLSLADGFGLEVFPDDSSDRERWRLLRPGELTSHVVVTGDGLDDSST